MEDAPDVAQDDDAPSVQHSTGASTTRTDEQSLAASSMTTDAGNHPHDRAALQIDEDDFDDHDSTYDPSIASSSASITSSVTNYLYENGRRYHAYREGEYYLPNDEVEQDRLDLQHEIWKLCLGNALYTAPIQDPKTILDIGTGTGIWAIDVSEKFPSATVIGTDLSPIQPGFVPPNTKFYVDDFEDGWDFPGVGKFDFIHWRALSGSTGNFPKLYQQARRELKPGAYLEVHEYDADIYSDDDPEMLKAPWSRSWCEKLHEASTAFGKTLNVGRFHRQWMEDAGFVDVHERVVKCPIGPWTRDPALKKLGVYERWHMNDSVEAHSLALYTRVLNHSIDEARVIFGMVRKEFNDRSLHLYTVYRYLYGRKPEE